MSRRFLRGALALFIHLYLCAGRAQGLRGVRVRIPEAVRAGAAVRLACDYDLEDDMLYSIKWYRGDDEFYRFVPKESPPTRVFPTSGIHVDISLSNAREVTLLKVQKQQSGFYKCEVSADMPHFQTEIKSAFMTVVDVPTGEPILEVDKLRFSPGEIVRANCTAPASYPAANITWFINGQPAAGAPPPSVSVEADGSLETARAVLELDTGLLAPGSARIRLRCGASLFNVFHRRSQELELREDTPQIASVLGQSHSGGVRRQSGFLAISMVLLILLLAR